MKVSFIGAGNVGTAIARYISSKVDVIYFNSRNMSSAKKSADYVGCQSAELDVLVQASDLIFITVSDNSISDVANQLSNYDVAGKTFVHMSGALSSYELNVLKEKGSQVCSMHPLQTFIDTDKAVLDLENAYFSLEGDLSLVRPLVEGLGNPYFVLNKEQKNKYHLSACIFSNYLVTLMNYGSRMMSSIGIDEDEGLKAMQPLIDATLSNVYLKGTQDALTGPIKRGDTKTLINHMTELEGLDLEAYQLLGQMTTAKLIIDDNKKSILDALWRRP